MKTVDWKRTLILYLGMFIYKVEKRILAFLEKKHELFLRCFSVK